MLALVKDALKKAPGDFVEIRLEDTVDTIVQFRGKELENIGTSRNAGGCVRTRVGEGWGFVSFNDLSILKESVENAAKQARLIDTYTDGKVQKLASVKPIIDTAYDVPVINPVDISLDEKEELARQYNNILLEIRGITSTMVDYRDVTQNIVYANSEGTLIENRTVETGCRFIAIAMDGTNVQKAGETFGNRRGYGVVKNLHEKVEKVAADALELLKASRVGGGLYTVIIDPRLSGVFAHEAFGHLSEADFVYENPKAREMMTLGRRFGIEDLSIVDDGAREDERGCGLYDNEGVPSRKVKLIDKGILAGRLHSRETAAKLKEEPTGNARAISYRFPPIVRMRCTYIEPRQWAFEDMVSDVDDGIYAVGSIGGNVDLERFTFSAMKAYRIKNGKIAEPIRDVVLSGNVFETLKNIDAIGNDLEIFGGLGGCGKQAQSPLPVSLGGPHMRISKVLIG